MYQSRQLVWHVPYTAGELKVVSKNKGKVICEKKYVTAEQAYGLQVDCDREKVQANGTDVIQLEFSVVDKSGTKIPHADHLLEFDVTGHGKIIGVENGDILDLSPHKVNYRKAFKGKCVLLLQASKEGGEIVVNATSKGLEPSITKITVNK